MPVAPSLSEMKAKHQEQLIAARKYNKNKPHDCKYCKKTFYQHTLGKHIVAHHDAELKQMLTTLYGKSTVPQAPFGQPGFYICMCCNATWDNKARALKHTEKHSVEEQLKAIYNLQPKPKDDDDGSSPELVKTYALLETTRSEKRRFEAKCQKMETILAKERAHQAEIITLLAELCRDSKISEKKIQNIVNRPLDADTSHIFANLDHKYTPVCLPVPEPDPEPQLPQPSPVKPVKAKPTPKAEPVEEQCACCKGIDIELKTCPGCQNRVHSNSAMFDCYMWDCEMCKTLVCYDCVKKAGGNKMRPFCSGRCHGQWRVRREDS